MTPERWQQISAIYQQAAAQSGKDRDAYLTHACGGDAELRREVESLLTQGASAERFLNRGAVAAAAPLVSETNSVTLTGPRLGVYEILAPLGAGGMGEVYRARDTKLGRDVAIKILPTAFTTDSDRLARFEREARILAALNHPHIAAIYGVEDSEGVKALVLELVEGETLAERLARVQTGGLPLAEAVAVARQIADALDAAHQKGIVHRDLKPANIKITPAGVVKVLDFGLAKLHAADGVDVSHAPTMTTGDTREGIIVGTAAYMSPEQARGQPVDQRTDVWAFGCVLYEMLTGRSAFGRATLTDTLAAVIEREPDWRVLPRTTPRALRASLERCLTKNAVARPGEARVLAAELDALRTRRVPTVPPSNVAAMAILIGAGAMAAWSLLAPSRLPPPSLEYMRLTNFPDAVHSPVLSTDGKLLAFVRGRDPFLFGAGELYVKVMPDGQPVALTHDGTAKMAPVFSPDGTSVVFTTSDFSSSSVPVAGGAPTVFMPNASGLRWIGKDRLLFSEMRRPPSMGIVTATASRGQSRDVYIPTSPQGMAHFSKLSPDGKSVLVVEMDTNAWMPCRLVPFDGSSRGTRVGPQGAECTAAAWSPDGQWMYFAAGVNNESHLWRQRFPDGTPEQLTAGTDQERGVVIEADGRSLITTVGNAQSVVWYHDERGDRPVSVEGYAYHPLVSPDGSKVFYLVRRAAKRSFSIGELWALDLASGRNERVLPDFLIRSFDISRDATTVVFDAFDDENRSRIWTAPADRSRAPRKLTEDGPVEEQRPFFSTNGEIFFMREPGNQLPALFKMRVDGSARQKLADNITFLVSVSPDARWAAVWAPTATRLISLAGEGTRQLCACATGPIFPDSPRVQWSADGKSLFVSLGYASDPGGGTVVLPWREAGSVPADAKFVMPADLLKRPGARLVAESSVAPGPTEQRYAFARQAEQSNLYRIRLR